MQRGRQASSAKHSHLALVPGEEHSCVCHYWQFFVIFIVVYSIVSNHKKFDIQEIGGSVVQSQDQINDQVQGKGDLEEILIIVPTLLCIL